MNLTGLFNNKTKIVKSDNINLEQWNINIKFLNNLDEFVLAKEDGWEKERQNFLNKVTPILVKIGVNFYRDSYRIPDFLIKNLNNCVWFIAAYPDVIDYFYPTSELMKIETQEDKDQLDERCAKAGVELDKFENKFKSGQIKDTEALLIELKKFYIETGNKFLLNGK